MAGANMSGGTAVTDQSVPSIGGNAQVVAGGHTDTNQFRAEGVNYNSNQSIGVDVTTDPYPAGTAMADSTPNDDIN